MTAFLKWFQNNTLQKTSTGVESYKKKTTNINFRPNTKTVLLRHFMAVSCKMYTDLFCYQWCTYDADALISQLRALTQIQHHDHSVPPLCACIVFGIIFWCRHWHFVSHRIRFIPLPPPHLSSLVFRAVARPWQLQSVIPTWTGQVPLVSFSTSTSRSFQCRFCTRINSVSWLFAGQMSSTFYCF